MNPDAQISGTPAWDLLQVPLKIALGLIALLIMGLLIELRILPTLRFSALLLIIASAVFLLVKNRGNADILNPVRVLGGLWCLCLALGSMRLLPTVSQWSMLMWECMLTGLVSFIVGFGITAGSSGGRDVQLGSPSEQISLPGYTLPTKRTLALASICLLVGAGILAYEDFLIGGIPILSDDPDSLRFMLFGATADPRFDTLSMKMIHPLVEFLKYGVFLVLIVLFQKKPKNGKIIFLGIVMVLLGTAAYSSQAGRLSVVTIAVSGLALFHYIRRRVRLIEIGTAVVALFLFIGIFGSVRINQSQSAPIFEQALNTSGFPQGPFWEGIAFGYATVTISFEVFYRLTEDLRTMQHPPSGFLFYSLHRFIPRASLGEVAGSLYSGESTTATFLGEFYGDYGFWGILFGPLAMGLLYGWAYAHKTDKNPIYWIYVRALLIQMLVFFPYANLFSVYITWVFDLFFMYFLIRYLTKSETQAATPLAGPTGAYGALA